jgi:hypothetical protein
MWRLKRHQMTSSTEKRTIDFVSVGTQQKLGQNNVRLELRKKRECNNSAT